MQLQEKDYQNFKRLLEYFVAHLELIAATIDVKNDTDFESLCTKAHWEDSDPRKRVLKDALINTDKIKLTGQGYVNKSGNRGAIQNQIDKWCHYLGKRICISVQKGAPSGSDRLYSPSTYLQWEDTGFDIRCKWYSNKTNIESLYIDAFGKKKIRTMNIKDLGLFEKKEPSENLRTFFYDYYKILVDMNKDRIRDILVTNYNLILTGAPGTGKTYLAKEIARTMTGDTDENLQPHYEMVQFHPSYDYSDFVEGLRPVKDATGNIGFERKDGVFKAFCKKALKAYNDYNVEEDKEKKNAPKYVFIIDEINRGEMSKIFGELFFSIDPGYRGTKGRIKTQYQNLVDNEYDEKGQKTNEPDLFVDGLFVPKNVYIIGTMNDIDRSVESMDFAMRRRFAFKEVKAIDRIDMWDGEIDLNKQEAGYRMKSLNKAIELIPGLSRAYHIGPSYFLKLKDNGGDFADLWNTHLEGLLFEYLRGMPDAEELRKKLYIVYNDAQDKELSDDDIKKIMGV